MMIDQGRASCLRLRPGLVDRHLLLLLASLQWTAVLHGLADDAFGDDVVKVFEVLVFGLERASSAPVLAFTSVLF